MKTANALWAVAMALTFGSTLAQQQTISSSLGLFAYPSNGQTLEQQSIDEQQCYGWANQTTGIDPRNPPSAQQSAQAPQQDPAGAAAQGALKGAARGALLANATDNDWEQAAAAGLVMGASRGAKSAQQRNAQAQQQAQQQQQQAVEQEIQTFKNAFSACMEGRKYTVR